MNPSFPNVAEVEDRSSSIQSVNVAEVEDRSSSIQSMENTVNTNQELILNTGRQILSDPFLEVESELREFRLPPLKIKKSSSSTSISSKNPENQNSETQTADNLEECHTPTGPEFMIPKMLICPPAPRVTLPEPPPKQKVKVLRVHGRSRTIKKCVHCRSRTIKK